MTKKKSKNSNLTTKQIAFCNHYASCLDGKKAAVLAGYKETNADTQSCELLKNPKIRKKITSLSRKEAKKTGIDREDIFTELTGIATSNMANYIEDEKIKNLPVDQQKAIKKFVIKEDFFEGELQRRTTTVELHDKLKAIDSIKDLLSISNPEKLKLERDKFDFDKQIRTKEIELKNKEDNNTVIEIISGNKPIAEIIKDAQRRKGQRNGDNK